MEKFIWTPEYSVWVESIDEQHRHFFGIANRILEIAEKDILNHSEVLAAIEELGNYAFYHLSTEEIYFDEFHYDGAVEHVAAHNDFREKTQSIIDNARAGGDLKKIAQEAASYAGQWLLNHILVMDKKYSQFFQEHGIK